MEGLQNGFTKLFWGAVKAQGTSLPQILCATKLEHQAPVETQQRDTKNQIQGVFVNPIAVQADPSLFTQVWWQNRTLGPSRSQPVSAFYH